MSKDDRTEILLGKEAVRKLKTKCVAVFGLGGVGSYCVESLARVGVGRLIIVDNDTVSESNINRQLYALSSTVGRLKTDVCRDRVKDINPDIMVDNYPLFYNEETKWRVDLTAADYLVDCIDSVKSKVLIAVMGKEHNIPVMSSLGTGNRLSNLDFAVADVFETSGCPLAKVFRKELRKVGIEKLKTVYSRAETIKTDTTTIGSVPFVPSVAGLIISGEVIKDLIK